MWCGLSSHIYICLFACIIVFNPIITDGVDIDQVDTRLFNRYFDIFFFMRKISNSFAGQVNRDISHVLVIN